MDKSKLKKIVQQFLALLEADGYSIGFAGIPPLLPEYESPYNLQLYSPKLLNMGFHDAYTLLVQREHEQLSLDARKLLSRIQLCRTIDDINCRKEDIIINKIKYKPLEIPYQMLEMA
jgi:hypothetical protein